MSRPLSLERDRFVAFAFAASDVLLEIDEGGRISYAAGALARFLPPAVDAAGLVGRPLAWLVREADRPLLALLRDEVTEGGRRGPVVVASAWSDSVAECSVLHAPESPWCHVTLRRLGQGRGAALATTTDPVTGLLNGDALGQLAEQEFLRLVETDQTIELSLVRLAGLETLPSRLDGDKGRHLMQRLAATLRAVSLAGGGAAHLGDDRFAVMHGGGDAPERLDRLLRVQLDAEGLESVRVERRELHLRDASLSPGQACAALRYAIERFAQDGCCEYDRLADALGQKVAATAARVAGAKAVIDSRAFFVLYQPIVHLADRRVHHHEALCRLHDYHSSIFEFVTFAETIGFITDFDLAVVREVLNTLARLRRYRRRPKIAVNLSARSLSNDQFVERLVKLSHSAGDNAAQLLYEVTESFQLTDLERADAVIQQLRRLGHQVCLDDFGAGAAAFHYIRSLEVDYVKLDGAFVQRVLASDRDRAILAGMVDLCRSLGVATVAEMVETEDQANDLRRLGVEYAQGHLFGCPSSDPGGPALAA